LEVRSKEVQYNEMDQGTLYCIKDGGVYVFSLYNLNWSIIVRGENQVNDAMNWDNCSHDFKIRMISEMNKIIRAFR